MSETTDSLTQVAALLPEKFTNPHPAALQERGRRGELSDSEYDALMDAELTRLLEKINAESNVAWNVTHTYGKYGGNVGKKLASEITATVNGEAILKIDAPLAADQRLILMALLLQSRAVAGKAEASL